MALPLRYLEQPTYEQAKGGCFRHERNQEGVDFAEEVPGWNGTLFLCAECILEAAQKVRIGRARRAKIDKKAAKAKAAAEAI